MKQIVSLETTTPVFAQRPLSQSAKASEEPCQLEAWSSQLWSTTAATGAGRGSKVIFEEEEDDEDVVVVVVGLEKEWKKAWGLVNMISFFLVLSFPAGLSWNGLQKRGGGLPFSRKL